MYILPVPLVIFIRVLLLTAAQCTLKWLQGIVFLVFMKMTKQLFTPTVTYAKVAQHVAVEASLGHQNSSSDRKYKTLKN